MPITIEVPGRGSEFPDGTTDAQIDEVVSEEFPLAARTSSGCTMTPRSDRRLSSSSSTVTTCVPNRAHRLVNSRLVLRTILETCLARVSSAMFSENIVKSPTSLVEGAAQGTVDLGLMIGKPTNPDSYGLRAWEFVFGAGSDEEQHKRHLDALESAEWMHNMREGQETLLLPKDFVNNDIVQMAANVADVSTFVPVAGWAGKAAVAWQAAQRVSSLPEAALKKGASMGASGTGTCTTKGRCASKPDDRCCWRVHAGCHRHDA